MMRLVLLNIWLKALGEVLIPETCVLAQGDDLI